MIENIKITSRDQWLALRRNDVTASAAGALLGVHEYATAYGLWALKSGKIEEDAEVSPAMIRGMLLEPVALKLLQMQRPDWDFRWNGTPGELDGHYWRDTDHRIGATPDCWATGPDGRHHIVQVKTIQASIFRRKWMTNDDSESAEAEISPPLWTVVQAIIESHLTKVEGAMLALLVIGAGLDMHMIDVPVHAGIIDRVQAAVADFWRRVAENDPPAPDYAADGATIAKLYGSDNGLEVDLRADNRMPALLADRKKLMAIRKDAYDRLEPINAELKHKLGSHAGAYVPGWHVTNKLQHRKTVVSPATSFRVLRVKEL